MDLGIRIRSLIETLMKNIPTYLLLGMAFGLAIGIFQEK